MKKLFGLVVAAFTLSLVFWSANGLPAADASPGQVRLIVETESVAHENAKQQLGKLGSVEELEFVPDKVVVTVPSRAASKVKQVRGVVSVERDVLLSISHHRPGHNRGGDSDNGGSPTQPPQETPWGINKTEAPEVWSAGVSGDSAKACIVDTGADKDHADLAANIQAGRNFTGGGPNSRNIKPGNWQDGNGHGTHVSGTVAALNNDVGVVGVGPDTGLHIAKVLDDGGSGWTSWIANGLYWCQSQDVHVVNMSFGGGSSGVMQQAISDLHDAGIILVAASGNSGASSPSYPAAYTQVIAVGATDQSDAIASFSNRGEDLNAPGVKVKSTVPGSLYDEYSGTSMAAPHVTGVVALLVSSGQTESQTIRNLLVDSSDYIGNGAIRVNALESYLLAAGN